MYSPYSAARAFGQLSSILRSVMTVTPAVWVLCDRAGPGRCGAARADGELL